MTTERSDLLKEYDEARSLQAAHYRAPHNGRTYPKANVRPFLGCSTCSNVTLRTQNAQDALHVIAAAANYERRKSDALGLAKANHGR